jgi:hypothetical protein
MPFNPGTSPFRLRFSISNLAGGANTLNYTLHASKNGGPYQLVTPTSTMGVKSNDAGSDADGTSILVPRLTMPT